MSGNSIESPLDAILLGVPGKVRRPAPFGWVANEESSVGLFPENAMSNNTHLQSMVALCDHRRTPRSRVKPLVWSSDFHRSR